LAVTTSAGGTVNGVRVRIFVEPQQGADYERLLAVARVAEELGFDGFFRSDHYLWMAAMVGDGLPGPTDAWVTLAGLARETTRLRLGTLVTSATFRLPGPLAISVAQVDAMSGGRIELGLGAGWFDDEHRAYGIPFPPMKERFDRLEEQLEILTGLWTTPVDDRFSYDGRHYTVADSPALPKPVQSPHPPLIVGGAGPTRTPRLAARFADEFNVPFHGVDDTAAQYGRVRRACDDAGRDPSGLRFSAAVVVCCGIDEAELGRRAAAIGRDVDELRTNGAAGSPAEVAERLRAYRELGATTIYLQVLDLTDLDHLRLIAEAVVPALG
jgi:F420-dependent oxidoreductase-like protein